MCRRLSATRPHGAAEQDPCRFVEALLSAGRDANMVWGWRGTFPYDELGAPSCGLPAAHEALVWGRTS